MAKWNILSSCFISVVHFPLYLGRLMSAFMAAFNSSCPYVVTTFIDENCVAYDSLASWRSHDVSVSHLGGSVLQVDV